MTVKMIKLNLFIQIKAWTSGSCLIERKFGNGKGHSGRAILREGEVAEFVVGESLIGRKANSLRGKAAGEVVHVVVAEEVVNLVGVDDEQSGSQERAFQLVKTNRLRARTFWSRLIERLFSLKRGEVVQVIVCGVVPAGVDEQAELQHNKRDGLNSWKLLKVSWIQEGNDCIQRKVYYY